MANIREGEGGTPLKRAVIGQGITHKEIRKIKEHAAIRLRTK
jgi:hypothetical protein